MIKTIIFDLGRVIIPFDFQHAYAGLEPYTTLPLAELPERVRNTDLFQRFEHGQLEPEQFVQEMSRLLDLTISHEQFSTVWSSIFAPETLIPEELLVALKGRYRLLLLSNTNALHFEMVAANYPLLRHFDHFVLSYKVGAMKPSPLIFQDALQHAQCAPEECFFTDDIAEYVAAAQREGIQAEQFLGLEKLQQDLCSRGVEW